MHLFGSALSKLIIWQASNASDGGSLTLEWALGLVLGWGPRRLS